MSLLTRPKNHKPRFDNFSLDGILDETLREGAERCPFSISVQEKLNLVDAILDTGVKDIVYGSGPEDPKELSKVMLYLDRKNRLTPDINFSFILLLNCHTPLMNQFRDFPTSLKKNVTISFGMISYQAKEKVFERAVDTLRNYGFNNFRVSLLNNFSAGVDEKAYISITDEINRAKTTNISTIRINDSLGTLYPEAVEVLAANLRYDYPEVSFCLHAHNDRGLGLQNALTSIYNGFNIIEGGFAGTGNRSGLPAIEVLDYIFHEKKISLRGRYLNSRKLLDTARLTESTFLSIPDLYRPVSGYIVEQQNMGITNIPSFLGVSKDTPYFLNNVGLHDETIKKIISDGKLYAEPYDDKNIINLKETISNKLSEIAYYKREEYKRISNEIERFYTSSVIYADRISDILNISPPCKKEI